MSTDLRAAPDGPRAGSRPLTLALVNDYEIIVLGLASMLAPFSDRVRVVEMRAGSEPVEPADVALFDTFAGRRHAIARSAEMVRDGLVRHVVLFTWDASSDFLRSAEETGVAGVVLKSQTAEGLVASLERVCAGERVGLSLVRRGRDVNPSDELSAREQEVLALLALGLSNAEIGRELYLSVDTIKTYVRRLYRKLGVKNRTQAALHAVARRVPPPAQRQQLADEGWKHERADRRAHDHLQDGPSRDEPPQDGALGAESLRDGPHRAHDDLEPDLLQLA